MSRSMIGRAVLMLTVSLLLRAGYYEAMYSASVRIPILMLHSITEEPEGTWSITVDQLREDILYMQEQGYCVVSLEQVIAYGEEGATLPDKPVCLTVDDGYHDNYTRLLPLLEERQVPATIFTITGRIRPESAPAEEIGRSMVSLEELRGLEESPWISVQSHSNALHEEEPDADTGEVRTYMLPMEGESWEHYRAVITKDYDEAAAALAAAGIDTLYAWSYPHGECTAWTDEIMEELGIRLTLTTTYSASNLVFRWQPMTLYSLGRMNVNNETTRQELLDYLERPVERESYLHCWLRTIRTALPL